MISVTILLSKCCFQHLKATLKATLRLKATLHLKATLRLNVWEFLKKPVFSEILKILSKMRIIGRKSVCYDICYYSVE